MRNTASAPPPGTVDPPPTVVRRLAAGARATVIPADPTARALTLATFGTALGTGLFYPVSALLFTRGIGLSPTTVGLGLTIAGGVGVAASFGAGFLADRIGARRLLAITMIGQAVALSCYVVASNVVSFILIAAVALSMQSASRSTRQALIARAFTGHSRVDVRARLRVVTNVSIGIGTCFAAIALLVDTVTAYRVTIVLVGLLTLSATWPILRLPFTDQVTTKPVRTPGESPVAAGPRSPLRDGTYLTATVLNGIISIQMGLGSTGIPLWIATATTAPTVMISALLVLNTVMIALFQVRASRGTHDVRVAGLAVRRAGVVLALACGLYALAAYGNTLMACVLLIAGGVLHTLGELWGEAGSWGLAFELADSANPGAYQGVSQTGVAIGAMLSPVIVTSTALRHHTPGWAVLAAMFLFTGLATAVFANRAASRRQQLAAA